MAREMSVVNVAANFNGHDVVGWSEDADAFSCPDVDLVNVTRGGDGRLSTSNTGNLGGRVMLKLQPVSRSTRFFMNMVSVVRNGGFIDWNAFVRYLDTGVTLTLVGGVLVRAPLGQTVGKGAAAPRIFEFEFEQIIPDYTAANFN